MLFRSVPDDHDNHQHDNHSHSHALDEEMVRAMETQHEIALSAAQSKIRSLETLHFQAETRAHALQKQVAALEDQLAHLRAASPGLRAGGASVQRPASAARASVRIVDSSDELRRASFSSARPGSALGAHAHLRPASPPSSFEGLSPEARHKRRVSLGMLKARIDSEAAAARSHPSSRAMSPAQKVAGLPTVSEPAAESSAAASDVSAGSAAHKLSQFLDESHIFWCASCKGDLVIL